VGLALMVTFTLVVVAASERPLAFPLDDAYITIHNAQVILSGHDLNYTGAPAILGATSLVHLALVTTLMLTQKPVVSSFVLGALGIVLYTLGLAQLVFRNGGTLLLVLVVVEIGLCVGYVPFQLLNGLETGLAMAAVTWALIFAGETTCSLRLPLLCGLLPFIRPELAIFSTLLMAGQACRRFQAGEDRGRLIARDFLTAALMAAPWMVWTWHSLGTVVPPTASAKVVFFAEAGLPAMQKLWLVWVGLKQAGLASMLCIACVARPKSPLWLFVVLFVGGFYVTFPGGLIQNFSRYASILVPPLLFMVIRAARESSVISLALVWLYAAAALHAPNALARIGERNAFTRVEAANFAGWASNHIPIGATVLIHDAGYISFATKLHLVDMVGLKTPESVVYHSALTFPSGGMLRGQAISEIARHFHADYAIILSDPDDFWGAIANKLRQQRWTLTPVYAADQHGYVIYRLRAPAD
jgi:hypothetical protein